MDYFELIIICVAGFLSAIIKNGVGIGSGIFLLPTLSIAFPVKTALGLGAPLMFASDLIGLRNYWREWFNLKEFLRLFIPSCLGLAVGTFLLTIIPGNIFKVCVGIFGMIYALMLLFPKFAPFVAFKNLFGAMKTANVNAQAGFYGVLAGISTILAHAGGVVWSIYLMTRNMDRRMFVGSIILMFSITNAYKVLAYVYLDFLSVDMLKSVLFAIPAVWVGAYLGNLFNKKINQQLFRKIVLVTIFIVSALLVIK